MNKVALVLAALALVVAVMAYLDDPEVVATTSDGRSIERRLDVLEEMLGEVMFVTYSDDEDDTSRQISRLEDDTRRQIARLWDCIELWRTGGNVVGAYISGLYCGGYEEP